MSKKAINVGLLGFGTVGSGAVKTLLNNRELINRRAGVEVRLVGIADIDLETDRGVSLDEFPGLTLTTQGEELIQRPDIDVVIETIGGVKIARKLVLAALEAGKDVITANKALLAEYADEVFGAAVRHKTRVAFEGAVGGGIPLIESVDGPLASSRIDRIWGILNGTCNYILTKMQSGEGDFQAVLAEAQELGYAEADPTLDIEGFDTAHKIALLASQCFGQRIDYSQISVEGITRLEEIDVSFGSYNGFRIKLLGVAQRLEDRVDVRVHPALIAQESLLAQVDGVFNAVYLRGEPVGGVMLYGRGAGDKPTGAAVVSDLIQLARGENRGVDRYEGFTRPGLEMLDPNEVEAHFYVRCSVDESKGALNEAVSILASEGVPVDMADRVEAGGKKVLMLTSKIPRERVHVALLSLGEASFVQGDPYAIPVEEVGE